jgi:hypothetical protein
MPTRAVATGLLIWTAGTIAIRLIGHRILHPGHIAQTAALYLISFALMALLIPRICRRLALQRELCPKAAILLILPTLILDPFSCAFFANVFPNIDPSAAGAFGGWVLICCGGAVAGVWRES